MAIVPPKHRPDPQKSLVGFAVGDVAYAVPIADVREIVNPLLLTELPHAPVAVVGVADHRGDVIPVVDLRTRFGLPPIGDRQRAKWILVHVEQRLIGLVVDRVLDVFGTSGAEIRPSPALGGGEDTRGIMGVTTHDGALTFVLDVSRFDELVRPMAQAGLLAGGSP
jgi:purine-binding chemotaxis protein CheW